jgi:hypothetical protein
MKCEHPLVSESHENYMPEAIVHVVLNLPLFTSMVRPPVHPIKLEMKMQTLNMILNQTQELPPPVIIDGEPEFEIAEVLDSESMINVVPASSCI